MIFLNRMGTQEGPFPLEQVTAWLQAGQLPPSTLAWHEGLTEWVMVQQLVPAGAGGQPPAQLGSPYQVSSASQIPHAMVGHGPQSSTAAVWSLVLGIISLVFVLFFILIPFVAIPAIICGHVARKNVKLSQGRISGGGMALAGLILGYVGLVVFAAIVLFIGVFATRFVEQTKAYKETIRTAPNVESVEE